jgi:hypothetical protein
MEAYMSYNYDDFVRDINYSLQLAKNELEERKDGNPGESTIEQLESCVVPDLTGLLNKVTKKEKLPPNTQQDRFLISFGYAFREWGWNINNPSALYLQLLKIHENYRKI